MWKKKVKLVVIFLICVFVVAPTVLQAASTPTLVTKLNTALKKILDYFEKLAPAAAGVAIASGVMVRKFSFGDEQKLILGKRIIVNAILGYAIILLIDVILKFVDTLV